MGGWQLLSILWSDLIVDGTCTHLPLLRSAFSYAWFASELWTILIITKSFREQRNYFLYCLLWLFEWCLKFKMSKMRGLWIFFGSRMVVISTIPVIFRLLNFSYPIYQKTKLVFGFFACNYIGLLFLNDFSLDLKNNTWFDCHLGSHSYYYPSLVNWSNICSNYG